MNSSRTAAVVALVASFTGATLGCRRDETSATTRTTSATATAPASASARAEGRMMLPDGDIVRAVGRMLREDRTLKAIPPCWRRTVSSRSPERPTS